MPYTGSDFTPTDPGSTETFAFDFVNDLGAGEVLIGASFSCAVIEGVDPDPASRLIGVTQIVGTKACQQVGNLVTGARYRLTATAVTNENNNIALYSHVTCEDPK